MIPGRRTKILHAAWYSGGGCVVGDTVLALSVKGPQQKGNKGEGDDKRSTSPAI